MARDGVETGMEIRRFFADVSDVYGDEVTIGGDEFVHMTKVLRHKPGYKIVVCPGDGSELDCTLTSIGADSAVARIDGRRRGAAELPYRVTLFQALPKGDKLSYIVQKCVELGAARIVPFLSEHTEETKFNRARMQRVAIEACKQCGRCVRCEVGELTDFDGVLSRIADAELAIMPYEHARDGRMGDVPGLHEAKDIALIIGSEGGFAPGEVERAIAAGAKTVTLGERILRCETAGLVALAIVDYERGELGK